MAAMEQVTWYMMTTNIVLCKMCSAKSLTYADIVNALHDRILCYKVITSESVDKQRKYILLCRVPTLDRHFCKKLGARKYGGNINFSPKFRSPPSYIIELTYIYLVDTVKIMHVHSCMINRTIECCKLKA
jgi:hypothetical protein